MKILGILLIIILGTVNSVTILGDLSKGTKQHEASIVLAIDGSASIAKEEWKAEVVAAQEIAKKVAGKKKFFSVVLFSSVVSVISGWSNDAEVLLKRMDAMKQPRGLTSTGSMLKKCLEMLKDRSGLKMVFMFTDGFPTDPSEVEKQLVKFKTHSIDIYSFGWGYVDKDYLNKMSKEVLIGKKMGDLLGKILQALTPIEYTFSTKIKIAAVQDIKEPLEIEFQIINPNRDIPKGTEFEVHEIKRGDKAHFFPSYYELEEPIKKRRRATFKFQLEHGDEKWRNVPENFKWEMLDSKGNPLASGWFPIPVSVYLGVIKKKLIWFQEKYGKELKILLLGEQGSGKTTFWSGLLTASSIETDIIISGKIGGGLGKHGTTKFETGRLSDALEFQTENPMVEHLKNVIIGDTKGIDNATDTETIMGWKKLVYGKIKNGCLDIHDDTCREKRGQPYNCIVLFGSHAITQPNQLQILKNILSVTDIISSTTAPTPLLLVTHLNSLSKESRAEKIKLVGTSLNIGTRSVYEYTVEEVVDELNGGFSREKSFRTDLQTIIVWAELINRASAFESSQLPNPIPKEEL